MARSSTPVGVGQQRFDLAHRGDAHLVPQLAVAIRGVVRVSQPGRHRIRRSHSRDRADHLLLAVLQLLDPDRAHLPGHAEQFVASFLVQCVELLFDVVQLVAPLPDPHPLGQGRPRGGGSEVTELAGQGIPDPLDTGPAHRGQIDAVQGEVVPELDHLELVGVLGGRRWRRSRYGRRSRIRGAHQHVQRLTHPRVRCLCVTF